MTDNDVAHITSSHQGNTKSLTPIWTGHRYPLRTIASGAFMKNIKRFASAFILLLSIAACVSQREPADESDKQAYTPPATTAHQTTDSIEECVVTGSRVQTQQPSHSPRSSMNAHDRSSLDKSKKMEIESPSFATAAIASRVAPVVLGYATDTEQYQHIDDNPVHLAAEQPVSTFSIDVDTGAYTNVRRFLNAGRIPPQDAVRVEEMINYFDYDYAPPKDRSMPFKVATELAPTPWNQDSLLLRIGIKGYEVSAKERPAANLVFLIDVSGSMDSPDKLPLLKNAFELLTNQLTPKDSVAIVVYAGNTGVVLEPTAGDQKHKIREALNRLEAGGSTNGGAGIKLAYQLAKDAFIKDGINRVILATDGDFNVGVVNFEALIDIAEQQRASGIAITTLGFGAGNYNDKLMERLADAGNGNYAYIDNLSEARKVLVSELSSTLFTIAKDVKIQIEFNPATVKEYRLIGYENRKLAREDFNNDKVDAGDIGAGHRVTALYEIVPVGKKGNIDPLRYGGSDKEKASASQEYAFVRLRYKEPKADVSKLIEYSVAKSDLVDINKTSTDFRFASSVAAFGQLLRGGKYVGDFSYNDVTKLAKNAFGEDNDGYRREFVSLVKLAQSLTPSAERVGRNE
jgi:Ca-activated chloride channel homolog